MKRIRRSRKGTLGIASKYGIDVAPLEAVKDYMIGSAPTKAGNHAVAFYLSARSEAEDAWRNIGHKLIEHELNDKIVFAGYEWIAFKTPGGEYTPDWFYLLADGRTVLVEIKGSKMQANYRDARSKLRAAASMNPWFVFVEALWERRTWSLEIIKPDLHIIETLIANGIAGDGEEV